MPDAAAADPERTNTTDELEIRPLRYEEIEFAAGLIGRAFRNLPTSIACFGKDEAFRARFLHEGYRRILQTSDELMLSAWQGGQLVGVMGIQQPGKCRMPISQKIRMAPFMIRSLKPRAIANSLTVFDTRDRHDIDETHVHGEPLAVEPTVKSTLIGTRLFQEACNEADRLDLPLFGITEHAQNVGFFETFGAKILDEFEILGVKNWAVIRPPHCEPPERLRNVTPRYEN